MVHKRSVAFNPWQPTVFDFDSAGTCWRAENRGVCSGPSATYFQAWVAGYRTSRTFGKLDEAAVAVFGIVGDLRVVAGSSGWPNLRAAPRGSALRICLPLSTAGLTGKSLIWLTGAISDAW